MNTLFALGFIICIIILLFIYREIYYEIKHLDTDRDEYLHSRTDTSNTSHVPSTHSTSKPLTHIDPSTHRHTDSIHVHRHTHPRTRRIQENINAS
jgi:hypothetical protein